MQVIKLFQQLKGRVVDGKDGIVSERETSPLKIFRKTKIFDAGRFAVSSVRDSSCTARRQYQKTVLNYYCYFKSAG